MSCNVSPVIKKERKEKKSVNPSFPFWIWFPNFVSHTVTTTTIKQHTYLFKALCIVSYWPSYWESSREDSFVTMLTPRPCEGESLWCKKGHSKEIAELNFVGGRGKVYSKLLRLSWGERGRSRKSHKECRMSLWGGEKLWAEAAQELRVEQGMRGARMLAWTLSYTIHTREWGICRRGKTKEGLLLADRKLIF